MSSQRRLFSLLEVVIGRIIGYSAAVCMQMMVFPLFGWATTWTQSAQVGLIFTLTSMAISFCVRRSFNYLHSKGIGVEKDE